MSLKRLCQLQDEARLRYRVWSNEEDQWSREELNVMRSRGAVLARGCSADEWSAVWRRATSE